MDDDDKKIQMVDMFYQMQWITTPPFVQLNTKNIKNSRNKLDIQQNEYEGGALSKLRYPRSYYYNLKSDEQSDSENENDNGNDNKSDNEDDNNNAINNLLSKINLSTNIFTKKLLRCWNILKYDFVTNTTTSQNLLKKGIKNGIFDPSWDELTEKIGSFTDQIYSNDGNT